MQRQTHRSHDTSIHDTQWHNRHTIHTNTKKNNNNDSLWKLRSWKPTVFGLRNVCASTVHGHSSSPFSHYTIRDPHRHTDYAVNQSASTHTRTFYPICCSICATATTTTKWVTNNSIRMGGGNVEHGVCKLMGHIRINIKTRARDKLTTHIRMTHTQRPCGKHMHSQQRIFLVWFCFRKSFVRNEIAFACVRKKSRWNACVPSTDFLSFCVTAIVAEVFFSTKKKTIEIHCS